MRSRLLALVLIGAVSSGCAKYYWSRPGGTAEEFYRDSQECARKVSAPTVTAVDIGVDQQAYRRCLRERGYVREKKLEPAAPGWYRGIE